MHGSSLFREHCATAGGGSTTRGLEMGIGAIRVVAIDGAPAQGHSLAAAAAGAQAQNGPRVGGRRSSEQKARCAGPPARR